MLCTCRIRDHSSIPSPPPSSQCSVLGTWHLVLPFQLSYHYPSPSPNAVFETLCAEHNALSPNFLTIITTPMECSRKKFPRDHLSPNLLRWLTPSVLDHPPPPHTTHKLRSVGILRQSKSSLARVQLQATMTGIQLVRLAMGCLP